MDIIPASTRVPGTYVGFDYSRAGRTLAAGEQYMVILGQRLDTGTVKALTPVDVYSAEEAAVWFGRGSMVHRMVAKAIDANSNLQLAVCALDDDKAGVAATATLLLDGTASGSGQVRLQVADLTVAIAVTPGDRAVDLMDSLVSAIAARAGLPLKAETGDIEPITFDGHAKVKGITLSALNKGTSGNDIGLKLSVTAAGLTGVVKPMAGGTGDPDIAPALAAIFSAGHTVIVMPYSTDTAMRQLATYLDKVSGPVEQRGAIGVTGWRGTLAAGTTLTDTVNASRTTTGWHNGSLCSNGEIAAVYAATIISEDDPSEPLDNRELIGLDITPQSAWPMRTEEEKALHNGLTPFRVQGSRVQLVRAISNYVKNAANVEDDTLLDITTIRTLDAIRLAWRTRISQRFPNGGKLTDRRLLQIRSETLDVLYAMERLEWVEDIDTYKNQVTVTRNLQDRTRADVGIPAPVVRGLHILTGTVYLY
ncbi:phage tail sheath subtilisin-like domain-containing protein [Enterobacter asburiae]